jgi:SAM-dependent methyltransferase
MSGPDEFQREWRPGGLPIDYDLVADVYDLYVTSDFDVGFYVAEAGRARGRVLELMSGTGRVSIPLAESGVDLTCVDASEEMLARLERKLRARDLRARVVRADIRRLTLPETYDLAIIPFHSFSELVSSRDQVLALRAIHGCLKEGGRLICSLQDPTVRSRSADGALRINGAFPAQEGTLVVSGFETHDERTGIIDRMQFYEVFDAAGNLRTKRLLPMRFALIGEEEFEGLARTTGFRPVALYGDYEYGDYRAGSSPYMVWIVEKQPSPSSGFEAQGEGEDQEP